MGEPITLEFKCGHTIANTRPLPLSEATRASGLNQAIGTLCPFCAPHMWAAFRHDGTMPEMRMALLDALDAK